MSAKIFVVSGGTGGHIIPAICLAKELSKDQQFSPSDILLLGDEKIPSYCKNNPELSFKVISSSQIRKQPVFLAKAALKIFVGFVQSSFLLLKHRPQYLYAFGGYATFPTLLAAISVGKISKTKIILHEQNSHLGKVNRIFAKYAEKIALSFEKTSGISFSDLAKTTFTGNPVRSEILALSERELEFPNFENSASQSDENKMGYNVLLASDFAKNSDKEVCDKTSDKFNILVIGGSGGAKIFSEILPKAFFNLSSEIKDHLKITQQSRAELVESTFDLYKSFNLNVVVDSFFQDMPKLLGEAHLVIARSGSSSIFEICAAKKPMILVPFAQSADDHQEKNAQHLENEGAAIVIREKDFTINRITSLLSWLIGNENELMKFAKKAEKMAVLDATKNLSQLIK